MTDKDPVIAFKLLTQFIRSRLETATDEHQAIPWIDMPEYKTTKITMQAIKDIYRKALYLSEKFQLDGYELIDKDILDV